MVFTVIRMLWREPPEAVRRKAVNGMRKNDNTASAVQRKVYKISVCAVLTALALIFSYVEALFPFQFGIPGMKLGLSNLVVLVALYRIGASYALSVNLARILLSGLLFGGVSAMMYSLAGGMFSFITMLLLKKTRIFSPLGVSMAGGVTHNIGQLTVAALVVENSKIYLYLPALLISGTVTGVLLGFGAVLILNRLKR